MRLKLCIIYICVVSLSTFVVMKEEKHLLKRAKCKDCMDVISSFLGYKLIGERSN